MKPFFRTQNHTALTNLMGSCLSTFTELYGIQHSNLKQKWFQGIMTCQKITQVITDFVKTLNQVRTFFRNFRDSSSENHHVKAQNSEREKKKLELKFFPPYSSLHIPDSSDHHVYVESKKRRRLHTGIIIFTLRKHDKLFNYSNI